MLNIHKDIITLVDLKNSIGMQHIKHLNQEQEGGGNYISKILSEEDKLIT